MNSRRVSIGAIPQLARELVESVAPLAHAAVTQRGQWSLAIPGGSAMDAFVPALAASSLPWHRAHVFWCDERAVSPDDAASNWRSFRALPGIAAIAERATLHPMNAEHDLETAAAEYERSLRATLGTPPVIDVVLLGVGEDGHVASLFPGRVHDDDALVVVERNSPKPPPRRLSLGYPLLASARLTCLSAFGRPKQQAMHDALDPEATTPAARVVREAHRLLVLVDPVAAVGLARGA